jgi:hypothetical protein
MKRRLGLERNSVPKSRDVTSFPFVTGCGCKPLCSNLREWGAVILIASIFLPAKRENIQSSIGNISHFNKGGINIDMS